MVKQQPTITDLPERLPGETDKVYWKRVEAGLAGENIRSKADLRDWTGSLPFHLNREPKP